MATVKFTTFAKRRNSTKQPTSVTWDTRSNTYLKEATSQDRPVFKVTGNNFNYNYCEWDGKYYFIDEIESLINNEIAVHCVLDPLATYKTEIMASTQFVSYSASESITTYLIDTRMPILKNRNIKSISAPIPNIFHRPGFYVMTAVGKDGCYTYGMDDITIAKIIDEISNWQNNGINNAVNLISSTTGSTADFGDAVSMLNDTLATIGEAIINSDFVGNAYAQAPSCIRSCIWVPFNPTKFLDTGADLWLGNFKTSQRPYVLKGEAYTETVDVTIPWNYTGWRRAHCENVGLYLPLVGHINLAADDIVNVSTLHIKCSVTATDGCICYEIYAGSGATKQLIGTYGGQCSANYPIGISQQASAGQIVQTAFAGTEKAMNVAVNSTISPISMAAAPVATGMAAIGAMYDMADVAASRNNTCIGGIGGGAGSGLDLDIYCYSVGHDTVVPWDATDNDFIAYKACMGVPVMKALPLSGLTGFTQCANAHVEVPATAGELDAIDSMINSGFYIE